MVNLPNPIYIDANARHDPSAVRLLAYMASEGKEGVGGETHLAVSDLDTPGAAVNVAPGSYAILARHTGGAFETYVGKIDIQQQSDPINPTGSGGPRTDLVILRIENPYVSGAGSWLTPADPVAGPYAKVVVVENVPANTNSVRALAGNWSAITLARITRPASTGIVQQSHITELRSLAKIGGERVVIIDDPPVDPPPIAQSQFFDVKNQSGATETLTQTPSFVNWHAFPSQADWNIPVPAWATGADILFQIHNIRLELAGAIGKCRINIGNGTTFTTPADYDLAHNVPIPGWERHQIVAASTVLFDGPAAALKGKVVRFRAEHLVTFNDGGWLRWAPGTTMSMFVVFKQAPIAG